MASINDLKFKTQNKNILELANALRWKVGPDYHDMLMESIYKDAARIAANAVSVDNEKKPFFDWNRFLDKIITSKITGYPIMMIMLGVVLWLTISGANVPSGWLTTVFLDKLHPVFRDFGAQVGLPWWLNGLLFDGMYLAMAWVISVMLPPMAIFFPLFTLLEDFGFLPRVAFNLDNIFKKVGAHGKQALSMSMGFGCNAAGVIATRIIDSPREKLIAIITNNFALCNGRWPTQILIATLYIGALVPAALAGFVSAFAVFAVAMIGVILTFVTSWILSSTILRGEVSTFSLELPPYRKPQLLRTLYTSFIDRTIFVLWRAIVFAIPAGAVIWLISNIHVTGMSIAEHTIQWLDPFGLLIGLNGVILLAYIIAIPANEIVIPTILMLTVLSKTITGMGEGAGVMFEFDELSSYAAVFSTGGWTLLTAVNLMLFSLVHNPCSTTLYTIYKETRSIKWTLISAFLPVVMGILICFFTAQFYLLLV